MIQTNDFERQVEEITINVPWGHISCKWWGLKSVRPIVCLHGWQDNCQSFDPLIYELPDHLSYLAVDWPGHGRSSRIPDGMVYSTDLYFYSLLLICDHFRWETISLMSHSLGSPISFLYAATFPNKCDMVIALDGLKPVTDNFKLINRHFSEALSISLAADIRNRDQMEPPSYTYDELLVKLQSGFKKISEQSAPYLLQRSVLPSKKESFKYYFSRDSRLNASTIPMMGHNISTMFARKIISPYCYIKAITKIFDSQQYYEDLAHIVAIMHERPCFEMHLVEGGHHVHLNDPSKVSGIISAFLNKYRPKDVLSKL